MGKGSGDAYWESVIRVFENHYGFHSPVDKGEHEEMRPMDAHKVARKGQVLDLRTPEDAFKSDLEDVLDDGFPKGECKERGAALVLFAYANILFAKHLKRALKK